jgi:Cytochrome C'
VIRIKTVLVATGAVLACLGYASTSVLAGGTQKPPAAAAAVRPLTLPISLLDVMRASVEIPADGIWAAEAADKLSEDDWQLADQDAVNLIAATTLLASGGTGTNDAKWVANADWQTWVRDMQKTAAQIRAAVKAMDQKKMAAVADHLQEICEACHTKYRPQAPSDGLSRYPFYPKRELAK